MKSLLPLLALPLLLSSTLAPAAEPAYSKTFQPCLDNSGGVTALMHHCISAEIEVQDKLLNANYKKLMANLTAERKNSLKTAQRLWLKYRKANCDFYYDPDGGSFAGISAGNCKLDMTANRAQELADLAAGPI
ncbi:lysozyme inhibitor LprI family protein [Candidatus Venteria ishoeyi]|uniref:Lysozyme inhibitor LprI-like N-terminal domain-containing protein n=1 Tax=Candidatus Venteria ishoeyi TaxID=1899563 RepID=A0A1H6FGK9_9GAMM|nr:lysozyme inhibitor LprI family protein [Candidatus Venteria ishoeyi]MDM8546444.1 lysozyme inhibitor LprI family protein [Candidatus Venteria ishoeyi]SEH08489.1 Uncharacterised protein [Candidatus Venteria ishoeyi]